MQLSGGLDLGHGVEVGHHRELFAPPEQRAAPAVGHDFLRQPGVRNNRKAHVREVRGLMGEDTQVVVAGLRERATFSSSTMRRPRPWPRRFSLTTSERISASDELSGASSPHATIDPRPSTPTTKRSMRDVELAQLAGQEMTRLLIALNQLVDPPRIAPDSRPKLRRAPTRGLLHVVTPANTSLNAASSNPSARSSSASVMISGGSSRMTFPAVRFTSTPCRMAASCTAVASHVQFEAPHQPRASNLDNRRMLLLHLAQPRFEVRAGFLHVLHQAGGQLVETDQRGAAREQVSTERGAVVAEGQRRRNLFLDERGAHRHAAGQCLADRDQVGTHAELLEVERLARCGRGRTALRRRSSSVPVRLHTSLTAFANSCVSGRTPPSP